MQSYEHLRKHNREKPNLAKKEFKMSNENIQNQDVAAFAALFSAAVLISASVGPAVQNTASFIA
jgi:hypothetical protein